MHLKIYFRKYFAIIMSLIVISCSQLISEQSITVLSPTDSFLPTLQKSAIISGVVDTENETGAFETIYVVDSIPEVSFSGVYTIRFEDSASSEIASYNFDTLISGNAPFILTLPWDERITRLVLLKNNVELDARSASANPPVVQVLTPNGGETLSNEIELIQWEASDLDRDELHFVVQYSDNGGILWQTLGIDLLDKLINFHLNFLNNTQNGVIRVLASDGFYTSQDTSDSTFTINTESGSTLYVDILEEGGVYSSEQSIILEGEAYTNSGSISQEDVLFTWSSNIDGVLAKGPELFIKAQDLTRGTHIITLTAEYQDLQIGSDSIEIRVYSNFSSLSVHTTELNFMAQFGDTAVMDQAVDIWHLGNHSITWSATADKEWITLRAIKPETPSYLLVLPDPSDMSIGIHTGVITITSNAEGVSSHTILVTLEITE